MGKERDWWSADLEGEMEKLEVEGSFSVTVGGSVDPERKVDHWSTRTVLTKAESDGGAIYWCDNRCSGKAPRCM